jgi:hypothetical protein
MSGLSSIRRVLREYRADTGLSRAAMLAEFAMLAGAIALVASGGWAFALVTP